MESGASTETPGAERSRMRLPSGHESLSLVRPLARSLPQGLPWGWSKVKGPQAVNRVEPPQPLAFLGLGGAGAGWAEAGRGPPRAWSCPTQVPPPTRPDTPSASGLAAPARSCSAENRLLALEYWSQMGYRTGLLQIPPGAGRGCGLLLEPFLATDFPGQMFSNSHPKKSFWVAH